MNYLTLVSMEKQYISIKEACEHFNKSISTIRRIIKKTPLDKLKKEKLVTGHEKIHIQFDYLNNYFNDQLNPTNQNNYSENTQNNSSNDVLIEQLRSKLESEQYKVKSLEKIITILNNELESKNKQIASLLERQFETNVLMKSLQEEKIKLDTFENNKKRKWWQRG
jgi:preprotein translocase subunit SecA